MLSVDSEAMEEGTGNEEDTVVVRDINRD